MQKRHNLKSARRIKCSRRDEATSLQLAWVGGFAALVLLVVVMRWPRSAAVDPVVVERSVAPAPAQRPAPRPVVASAPVAARAPDQPIAAAAAATSESRRVQLPAPAPAPAIAAAPPSAPVAIVGDWRTLPSNYERQVEPTTPESPTGWKSPWRAAALARHAESAAPHPVRSGTFAVATTMPDFPVVAVDWLIPVNAAGAPLPEAGDVVAVFPFVNEPATIQGELLAVPLATRWGFTVFTIRFPRQWNGRPEGPMERWSYTVPGNGSGQAWLDAAAAVRAMVGLPERPLFVCGRSSGGLAAQAFAVWQPSAVAGVWGEAGSAKDPAGAYAGPSLHHRGDHDHTAEYVDAMVAERAQRGHPVQVCGFRPDWDVRRPGGYAMMTHGITDPADSRYGQAWFADLANARATGRDTWAIVAGERVPGPLSAEALRTLAPLPRAMGPTWLALPIRAWDPLALVVLTDGAFASNRMAVQMDAEYLADCGVAALAIDQPESAALPAIAAVLRDLPALANLPVVVVNRSPSGPPADWRGLFTARLRGVWASGNRLELRAWLAGPAGPYPVAAAARPDVLAALDLPADRAIGLPLGEAPAMLHARHQQIVEMAGLWMHRWISAGATATTAEPLSVPTMLSERASAPAIAPLLSLGQSWSDRLSPRFQPTAVRVARVGEDLLLWWTMRDDALVAHPDDSEAAPSFQRSDVIEVFLAAEPAAGATVGIYREYHLTAGGVNWAQEITDRQRFREGDPKASRRLLAASGARGIVTQVPGGWQATMRIPLRELAGAKPLVNSRWRLGLGRYDLHPRRGPVLTHAAPLTQCDFHRHEEWIPIRFAR